MIIQIYLESSRTEEQKRAGAKAITKAACETLGVLPEWVHIIYENYGRNDWAIGGRTLKDKMADRLAAEAAAKGN
jgi:4-oxalocrotonate tautomerase